MKKLRGILVLCSIIVFIAACKKSNNNTPFPAITLTSFTADSIKAGFVEDTAIIYFDFIDGDGNLGIEDGSNSNKSVIVIKDSRSSDSMYYKFPDFPPEAADPLEGMKGITRVSIPASGIILRADSTHAKGDTLHYTIHVVDNSGNQSNRITTPDFIIHP